MQINPNSMSVQDIEILQTTYCDGCCMSCSECGLYDFVRVLNYLITEYNQNNN